MRYGPDKRFLRSRYLQQGQGQIKVIPRHCTATYLNQYPYQVSISYTLQFLRYSLEKKLKIKVTKARSKVKSRSHFDVAHLHPPINVPILRFNLLHLIVSEISPRQDFKGQGDYSKVKGHVKAHHYIAHLNTLTNIPIKYQLPICYGYQDIAQTRFLRSRSH